MTTLVDTITAIPVRYQTDQDPYHYTIENRPIIDLDSRDIAIAHAVDTLTAAVLPAPSSLCLNYSVMGVNCNVLGDTPIIITLPSGYTTYYVNQIFVIGASGTFTNARMGAYTGPSQSGATIASQTLLSGITSTTLGVATQFMGIALVSALFNSSTIFINVGTAQGSASVANIVISIRPFY